MSLKMNIFVLYILTAAAGFILALPSTAKEWRVFIMGGQSNMEGVGLAAEAPSNLVSQSEIQLYHSPSVRSGLPANQWNPLAPAGVSPANFGSELSFAYRMAEALGGENIALIKHARGGTKLTAGELPYETTSWHPGESPSDTASFGAEFSTFVHTVTNALAAMEARGDTPVLSGMLWVQGEADSTSAEAGAAYLSNITQFVARVRQQFNVPELPFVCARILPYQTRPGSASVRQALADIDQDSGSDAALTHVYTVYTEGLGVNSDNVHFNTPGQLGLGTLLARSMCQRALNLPIPQSNPPTIAYWQFDESSGATYLLDAAGVYHLDKEITAVSSTALIESTSQPDIPRFIDASLPQRNSRSLTQCHGMRRQYDETLDMRSNPWTFEAFFKNNAVGDQSSYEVIGGTRSAMSQYYGWRVIMVNGKIRFFATANSGQTAHVLSALRYDDGRSHHLAAVWNPDEGATGAMRLYIDGLPVGESAGVGDLGDDADYTKLFALGGNISGTAESPVINSYQWNGVLDEIRMTAGVLKPAQFLNTFPKGTLLKLSSVNPLDRLYPDCTPYESRYVAHVPRGGRAFFQFALQTSADVGSVILSVCPPVKKNGSTLKNASGVQVLLPVPVEANYCGCARTQKGKLPSGAIRQAVVRPAPFDVYEVLADESEIIIDGRSTYAAVVRVDVPRSVEDGLYRGELEAQLDGHTVVKAPIEVRVYQTSLPEIQPLDVIHWLWPEPQNLTCSTPPAWWSEDHWRLLETSGATLHDYGDTVMFTPLFASANPLIKVISSPGISDSWSFDFSRFDRWVKTFRKQGFTRFFGRHISNYRSVYTYDKTSGKGSPLKISYENYHQVFLPVFYKAFYKHLCRHGWENCYIQALTDEPRADALQRYEMMAGIFRKHMPGIGITEALNHEFDRFSEFVDVPAWWFGYVYSKDWPDLIRNRIARGKENWIYYACTPTPPHPNSHLDVPLWRCRVLPWVADYCRSEGILHWGANIYRGANPYESSIGPLPDGSVTPGHPPGDNWLFYPTEDGLTGSMRMAAFQQGIEDFALLKILRTKDAASADSIAGSIVNSMVLDYRNKDVRSDYADNALSYSLARRQLLEKLDSL